MNRASAFDRRWFAYCAIFSLLSLAVIPTGDVSWLVYLVFLGFLAYLVPQATHPKRD